jgi:hypothetical protein
MEGDIGKTVKALEKRQIRGWIAESLEQARDIVCNIVPPGWIVGIGDSSTVRQIGAVAALREKGNRVINPFERPVSDAQSNFDNLFFPSLEATICDVYLTGTNGVSEDGRLVNVDGNGNRVAGMVWGHPMSIVVVGKNKIAKTLDEAMDRVKNVVCPEHLKRKGEGSPCTKSGRCHDCTGEARVCAVTTIIERKPLNTELHVVIVNKDLGLSWDRSWPEERIEAIVNLHEKFMWGCPIPASAKKKGDQKAMWDMARARGTFVWSSTGKTGEGASEK